MERINLIIKYNHDTTNRIYKSIVNSKLTYEINIQIYKHNDDNHSYSNDRYCYMKYQPKFEIILNIFNV